MGVPRNPAPAALIAGITFVPGMCEPALGMLRRAFGELAFESPDFAFDPMTGYYRAEMGGGLVKRFVCFREPVMPGDLPEVKLRTNDMERELAGAESGPVSRRVNIDPGYVTPAKLVLASTKDYSHRIYIGRGIYAETTLRCHGGTFSPIDTTYPDYRTPLAIEFFNAVRDFAKGNRVAWSRETESNS